MQFRLRQDIYRTECPSVDFQSLTMFLCCVAVSLIVGVGLYDICFRQFVMKKFFYPWSRDNVRSVLFSCVQLYTNLTVKLSTYAL